MSSGYQGVIVVVVFGVTLAGLFLSNTCPVVASHEPAESEHLDRLLMARKADRAMREAVAEAVAREEMSFPDAVVYFRTLAMNDVSLYRGMHRVSPLCSEVELCGRNVVTFVRFLYVGTPEGEAIITRVQNTFETMENID